MDELSLWVLADELVLKGELEISSRWVAMAVLASIYPAAKPWVLGLYVGAGPDGEDGLADARRQDWWREELVQLVMLQTLAVAEPPILVGNGAALNAERVLRELLKDRLATIHRSIANVG